MSRFPFISVKALGVVVMLALCALAIPSVRGVVLPAARNVDTSLSQPFVEITKKTTSTYQDAYGEIRAGIKTLEDQGGGVLFFGPGKYIVSDTIEIPSNITIQGAGSGEVGPCMVVLGVQGDLNAQGKALFAIKPGATNVKIRDMELRSMTPGWNIYPRNDIERINSEQTAGIRMGNARKAARTSDIELDNLRITNFTHGIDAGGNAGGDPTIERVIMRNVSAYVNAAALRVNSLKARDWDIQNLNVVEMSTGQKGVVFERTGAMSFLQLSCASTLFNADVCMDIAKRSGELYFLQAHVEGPRDGVRVREESSNPIYFDNSAFWGTVEKKSVIYSIASRFYSDLTKDYRLNFTGSGSASKVYACGDVYTKGLPNLTATGIGFPGLKKVPTGCNVDPEEVRHKFSTGKPGFDLFNRLTASSTFNVKNFGAKGDGITDDTEAIRRAMRETPQAWSRSLILFPAGTYRVSGTLNLGAGMKLVGQSGAAIEFTGTNRALFQLRALQTDPVLKRSVHMENLILRSATPNPAVQNTTAIEISGTRGGTSDHSFTNLQISGFTRGMYITHDSGVFDNGQPLVDSVAVRNVTFSNNFRGMEFKDQNASNWNLENIAVTNMQPGQTGVLVDGGGHLSFRGLTCQGAAGISGTDRRADTCMSIARHSDIRIEDMVARDVKYALYTTWRIGWTPFSVYVRDSDLTEGVYFGGKTYLLSVNNIYPHSSYAAESGTTLRGSRSVFFAGTGVDSAQNIYPGINSKISSCGDRSVNPRGQKVSNLEFNGLVGGPEICFKGDQTGQKPVVSTTTSQGSR